jgi:hypothetical protein
MFVATRPMRKHLDVACPTCAAQVGERCVTVRRLPWMERWEAPTHPAHTARQLLSADSPARACVPGDSADPGQAESRSEHASPTPLTTAERSCAPIVTTLTEISPVLLTEVPHL